MHLFLLNRTQIFQFRIYYVAFQYRQKNQQNHFYSIIITNSSSSLQMQSSHLPFVIFLISSVSQVLAYNLNQNLLINGDFSQPAVAQTSYFSGSPLTIPGWYCSNLCQIDNCTFRILQYVREKKPFPQCTGQVLDIDALGNKQNISQNIQLDFGYYNLSFDYFWPFQNSYKKTLLVYFNDQLVFSLRPQLNTKVDNFNFYTIVRGKQSNNILTFTETDDSFKQGDPVGFRITNVSLKSFKSSWLENFLNFTIDSTISQNINLIPGSRVIFGQLMNMFINLDRYQFYYFHNRNYSINSLIFLKGISQLLSQKGSLVSNTVGNTIYGQIIDDFLTSLDYKKKYTDSSYLLKDSTGDSFVKNNAVQFLLNIPIYLLVMLLTNLLYLVLKNYYVGKFLVKFTMFVVFLLMLIQGNIEQYSYYMWAELSNFFSASFRHKMVNVILLLFFYMFILSSVGVVWFIVLHYKKKGKVLINSQFSNFSFCIIMLEKGIICILLGAIHKLLLVNYPNFQLFMLMGVEICLLIIKFVAIYNNLKKSKIDYFINILQGIVRIFLQIQFYYESQLSQSANRTQRSLLNGTICSFLTIWGLSCLHSAYKILLLFINNLKLLFLNIFKPKRIDPLKETDKKKQSKHSFTQIKKKPVLDIPRSRYQHVSSVSKNKRQNLIRLVYQTKIPINITPKFNKLQRDPIVQKQKVKSPFSKFTENMKQRQVKGPQFLRKQTVLRLKNVMQNRSNIKKSELQVNYFDKSAKK